jgi:HlyD family secretion protein
MTANLTMTVAERNNILKVPNAALRFRPQGMTQEQMREARRNAGGNQEGSVPKQNGSENNQQSQIADEGLPIDRGARRNGERTRNIASATDAVLPGQTRIVWVLGPDQKPQPRRIKIGITDGSTTEIVEGNLNEGETIIVGQNVTAESRPQTQAPRGFGGAPSGRGGGMRR